MRQPPEFFNDEELPLIYVAKKLRHAKQLEEALTAAGIDYAVEADTYRGGILFVTDRTGAFFYVRDPDEERARAVIVDLGFKPIETEKS